MSTFTPAPKRFRVWDGETMHGDSLNAAKVVQDGEWATDIEFVNAGEPPGVWMQSTGLRDADGVEVFEGDVIGYGDFREVVVWDDSRARFTTHNPELGTYDNSLTIPDDGRVVGNVFEHPHLLAGDRG